MTASTTKPSAALAMDPATLPFVFGPEELKRLDDLVELDHHPVRQISELPPAMRRSIELLITGWGPPQLQRAQLDALPALRAIVHWGGSAGFIDQSARSRGIAVSTARLANGIPVAEFTVAMITLAAKDAFWMSRRYAIEQRAFDREAELPHTGLHGRTIGLVGASTIGSLVIERLAGMDVDVLVYDPYLSASRADELGVEHVSDLRELAGRSSILSVHAPAIPATDGMISRDVLAAMPDGATLINTARGVIVDQLALVEELRGGRLRAVLDVTEPEVLPLGHPLYTLPNVFLTPHLAGSTGNELRRLGHAAVDEVARFVAGEPFAHPFTV